MKLFYAAVIISWLLITLSAAGFAQGAVSVQEGEIRLSVVNKKGESVTVMRGQDLKLLLNGQEQEITSLRQQSDQPIALAVLIDTSNSQKPFINGVKEAAWRFIDDVIRPSVDTAAIVTINTRPELKLNLTSDKARLKEAIQSLTIASRDSRGGRPQSEAGGTAIYDAVAVTSDKLLARTPANVRRMIVAFSDGTDTSSQIKYTDAIRVACLSKVAVFFMLTRPPAQYSNGPGTAGKGEDRIMAPLAEATGGKSIAAETHSGLDAAFDLVKRYLKSSLVLRFNDIPGKGQEPLTVNIEIKSPELSKQKPELLYPKTYFR
ncbi:MAG TPA: VWA domain-containing protein [Blastocatellia bacterium]|nr:VWA domain-containing protein [Blastocatellia bacterium]